MAADDVVHSAVHPVLAPEKGSGMPPVVYYRQGNATDLGETAAASAAFPTGDTRRRCARQTCCS
jgi:hypothetical protein